MNNDDEQTQKRTSARSAGQKAVATKGKLELSRAGKMAAWTKANGKNDAENPFSKQNYPSKSDSGSIEADKKNT